MKITCNTSILADACNIVQRGVSQKSTIPATEGIFMQAKNSRLTLSGYDLEVGITTVIDCSVEQEGSIVLNSHLLCDILRRLPNDLVSIEIDEHNLCKIHSGDSEFSLIGIPADDYPELPTVSGGFPFAIKKSILKEMIRQTIFAVSLQESRPLLTGINIKINGNVLECVATDSYRLAKKTIMLDNVHPENIDIVIPGKNLMELSKIITFSNNHLVFVINNVNFVFIKYMA